MREAFREAARENPKSPISGVVRGVERKQYEERKAERHARELDKLGGRLEYIGRVWLNHRMRNHVSISMRTLKEEWKELPPLLANIEESERVELIGRLAKGLMLSEERTNAYYKQTAIRRILENPLEDIQAIFAKKTRFSPASEAFFEALTDICGYSKEQKASFKEFMSSREDLSGLVRLPQTFPAVAEWLVQSRNDSQSSRLS